MMRHVILSACAALQLLACACGAAEFTLSDPVFGESYGPFTYTNGAIVTIDGRELVLKTGTPQGNETEARMRAIIIPELEFRRACIADIVAFFIECSRALEPGGDGVGINIVLNRPRAETEPENKPSSQPDWFDEEFDEEPAPQDTDRYGMPLVTLNLRKISLYEALTIVCEVTGLQFRINEAGVVIVESTICFFPEEP